MELNGFDEFNGVAGPGGTASGASGGDYLGSLGAREGGAEVEVGAEKEGESESEGELRRRLVVGRYPDSRVSVENGGDEMR